MKWIHLAQDRAQLWVLANTIMNHVPQHEQKRNT
jgi:hypothetical protein